jgi:hypothetical protein
MHEQAHDHAFNTGHTVMAAIDYSHTDRHYVTTWRCIEQGCGANGVDVMDDE